MSPWDIRRGHAHECHPRLGEPMRAWGAALVLVVLVSAVQGQTGDDNVLSVVSSAFSTQENGDVEQVFLVEAFNVTTGQEVASAKLSQMRRQGRPTLTCTASDPNTHALFFLQTDPDTQAFALYNLTSTTPGQWLANSSFVISQPLAQPEVTSVCQATRFSGYPQEHDENDYVWLNPSNGPIIAIDTVTGDYREVTVTDKQGESCCVQGVDLENYVFYSVYSGMLWTIDMNTGLQSDQRLAGAWYFLDVPLQQSQDNPELIVVEQGNSASNNYAPRLVRYNARDITTGEVLYQFDEKTAGLYNGIHQTLMTKSRYFVALRNIQLLSEAEYTVFVFDTADYGLQSQFTFTLADPSLWVYGLM